MESCLLISFGFQMDAKNPIRMGLDVPKKLEGIIGYPVLTLETMLRDDAIQKELNSIKKNPIRQADV